MGECANFLHPYPVRTLQMADEFMSAYDNQAVVTLLGLDERADTRTLARRQAAAAEDPYAYVGSRVPISYRDGRWVLVF